MNPESPVFTIENECQDCYKCVRHCHCKAIRIVNAKASVIPEACVACGECVKVCPAHAKKIRSDYMRLKKLLESGAPVYASIAPSHIGYFKGAGIGRIASALKKAGFAGVGETALGAEAVSAMTCGFLRDAKQRLVISSACPAAVDYIRKYLPEYAKNIIPLHSPVLAHCRMLRDHFGENIKTVFFGPCAAKKNEADRNPELLNLALTFADLEELLEEKGIHFDDSVEEPVLRGAEEGRFYSIEGGMNDTLREQGTKVRFIAVAGLDNLSAVLSSGCAAEGQAGRTVFIEALACHSGCVNGPGMPSGAASLGTIFRTDRESTLSDSGQRVIRSDISEKRSPEPLLKQEIAKKEIERALARVGKFSKADELNCGACGYNTCRDFARALLCGKAEEAMCHNYLRKNFQRTSNALIKYIPAGVVIVNNELEVTESNRHFAELAGVTELFDTMGNLNSIRIERLLPDFQDLFESVIENGGEIEKYNQPFNEKIINLSVFSIARGKFAGAVIQDVTKPELQREQIAQKAQEVIRKNVLTVQTVARIFGEHIAESEILLKEIAGSYRPDKGKRNGNNEE